MISRTAFTEAYELKSDASPLPAHQWGKAYAAALEYISDTDSGQRSKDLSSFQTQKAAYENCYNGWKKRNLASYSKAVNTAFEEQHKGAEKVFDTFSNSVVQMNAATAEEGSASSEELAAQAQNLQHEVGKFKLSTAK